MRRVVLNDVSQLPNDYSTTPGGTFFSTTPGGKTENEKVQSIYFVLELIKLFINECIDVKCV